MSESPVDQDFEPKVESGEKSPIVYDVRGLRKSWAMPSGEALVILDGADLTIRRNEFLLIQGKSGIGKSTFLHILGLLDGAESGELFLDSIDVLKVSRRRRAMMRVEKIGFVFQFYHLLPEFTALENVLIPGKIKHGLLSWQSKKKEAREKAAYLLDLVGMSARTKHKPNQLSGGERQRVALARALFNDPSILLCDEPTGNLDVKTSRAIHDLLAELSQKTKQTMIVVTHDQGMADYATRVMSLEDGRFVE